jgi:hypothetical protein
MEFNEIAPFVLIVRGETTTMDDVDSFQLMEMFAVKLNNENAEKTILETSRKEGFTEEQLENIQKFIEQKRNTLIYEEFETQGKKGKFTGIAPLTEESFIGIIRKICKNFDKDQLISLLNLIYNFPPAQSFKGEKLDLLIAEIALQISNLDNFDKIKPTIH